MKEQNLKPKKKSYLCFSAHEEIGYGGATLPKEIKELLVVDMGCVGSDLSCTEEQVSSLRKCCLWVIADKVSRADAEGFYIFFAVYDFVNAYSHVLIVSRACRRILLLCP